MKAGDLVRSKSHDIVGIVLSDANLPRKILRRAADHSPQAVVTVMWPSGECNAVAPRNLEKVYESR